MATKKKPLKGELLPKRVRSTKYKASMCEEIIDIASNGGHVAQMCVKLGIRSKDTFYRWLNENSDFQDAYSESKLVSQTYYERILLMGALGQIERYNFNSMAMILNNKFGDDYKRSSTGSNTEINIGSINSIEQLDSEALENKIKQLNDKLGYVEGKPDSD